MPKTKSPSVKVQGYTLSSWLKMSGMKFDPFIVLEASQDPHLIKYLIEHDEFINIWGNWPNIVLAPPGAGKTAMRIKLTQACFTGGRNRSFPINYSLPFLSWGNRLVKYDEQLAEILNRAGLFLLLFLANRPHRYLALAEKDKQYVALILNWILPGPLFTFIEPCRKTSSLTYLETQFAPAILPPHQGMGNLDEFWSDLEKRLTKVNMNRPSLLERWESTVDMLIRVLSFPSIYILVDGIDASPNTAVDPQAGLGYLNPLLSRMSMWARNNIFLKFFLPLEMSPYLSSNSVDISDDITPIQIQWTESSLADVIRKRVYVASEGNFGSLQTFASPAIPDIEMQIAKIINQLPREMLVFTRQLLINHAKSSKPEDQIQPQEFEKTYQWYQMDRRHN